MSGNGEGREHRTIRPPQRAIGLTQPGIGANGGLVRKASFGAVERGPRRIHACRTFGPGLTSARGRLQVGDGHPPLGQDSVRSHLGLGRYRTASLRCDGRTSCCNSATSKSDERARGGRQHHGEEERYPHETPLLQRHIGRLRAATHDRSDRRQGRDNQHAYHLHGLGQVGEGVGQVSHGDTSRFGSSFIGYGCPILSCVG